MLRTSVRLGALLAVVASLAGCGGSGAASPAGPGSSSGSSQLSPVTGTRLTTFHLDDGTTTTAVSADLAQCAVSALVPDGAGFREVAGTFSADGRFQIPDAGSGRYLLRFVLGPNAPRYLDTTSRTFDLGSDLIGRPVRTVAQNPTVVTLPLTGLDPWSTGDSVRIFSTGARLSVFPAAPTAPVLGSTALTFTQDFRLSALPVAGDRGWIYQVKQLPTPIGGLTYTAAQRSAALELLADLADGTAVTLAPIPLGPTPSQGSVDVDLRRAAYQAAFPPSVTLSGFGVTVRGFPRNTTTLFPALLSFTPPAGTTDLAVGTLAFGNPFPDTFTLVREVDYTATARIAPALGSTGAAISVVMTRSEPLAAAPAVIAPTVGPVGAPTIAGLDALQPHGGVGLTPTIAWTPPSLGTPTHYNVLVLDVTAGVSTSRATLTTTATSVVVPPLVLVPGNVYVAVITATVQPGFDLSAPTRGAVVRDGMTVFTALFTP